MGVLGLTSFIENLDNEKSFKLDCKLKNTHVVIDGLCLLYKIYTVYHVDCAYGGNYDDLNDALNDLFDKFKKCNLHPIILFDGARDLSDRKLNTTLRRARERMKNATLDLESNSLLLIKDNTRATHKTICFNDSILPINAFVVLINVMKKFSVKYYQCNFEADYELACLANHLACPLISSDSDFYVYKLSHGYIPLENLDVSPVQDEDDREWHLNCVIYKLDNFIKVNNIQYEEVLSILAVLCGNDYVESKKFDPLLRSFKNDNNNSKKTLLKLNNSKNTKLCNFKRVLNWLNSHENKDECTTAIMKFIKNDEKANFLQIINESIDEYLLLKNNQSIIDSIFNTNNHLVSDQMINSFSGTPLSNEFFFKYKQYAYSRMFLDLLIHRKIILSSQIEMCTLPSSYSSSLLLRKLLYFLIIDKYDEEKSDFVVQEYIRYKRDIKIHEVKIIIDEYKQISITLAANQYNLFKHLFGINEEIIEKIRRNNTLTDELRNLFVLIYFWLYNAGDSSNVELIDKLKNINSIRTFMVTFIKITFVDGIFKKCDRNSSFGTQDPKNFTSDNSPNTFHEYSHLIHELFMKHNFDYLKELHAKLYQFNVINKRIYNDNTIKYVHCLSEFQAIYQSMFYLNQFYDENLVHLIPLESFFNGSVLTNFQSELESRVNPHLYCEELFGRKSIFKYLFDFLFNTFIELFEIDYKANEEQPKKKDISSRAMRKKELKKLRRQQQALSQVNDETKEDLNNDEAEELELKLVLEI